MILQDLRNPYIQRAGCNPIDNMLPSSVIPPFPRRWWNPSGGTRQFRTSGEFSIQLVIECNILS